MATLLSCASGNFTSASTWALVDPISLSMSETTSGALTSSYFSSSTFTPGAITIDAIAVKFLAKTGSAGTVSCALDQGGTTVTGTEVTINIADIPAVTIAISQEGGWTVFKFASPVTLVAVTAYAVKLKTIGGSISAISSSGGNWLRMLRTTMTQAPAAGDDMHIAGEYTGAGTSSSITVYVDTTAAIDYGSAPSAANSLVTPGIGISAKGTLQFLFGLTATLRLSNSLIIYNGGIFNMGTVSQPMDRPNRAILEFDQLSADGDYGLTVRNGGTFVAQGQSRTSGKNVASCKLAADAPSAVNLIGGTSTNAGGSVITANAGLDPVGISRLAFGMVDSAVNANHYVNWISPVVAGNTTQTFSVWLARGSGTNNRYVRLVAGTSNVVSVANGFYCDFDLQVGTAGTVTAVGVGTAISASMTALGSGYICTIIGRISSGSGSSCLVIAACNSSGGVTYTGDATQNFLFYGQAIYTASALPSADLTVDTDTGWLAGDLIAVASTSRTYTDCEILSLASNATSTTLTTTQVATAGHSGTTPTQAEIINLTRNVVIRSTSSTLMAYVNIQAGATADIDWCEFYWLGANTTNKRGIEVSVSTTLSVNFDMRYCSVHDCKVFGIYLFQTGGAILITNCMLAYNVMWYLATTGGPSFQISQPLTPTNWTIDHNILIRNGFGNAFTLNDVGGTFTNNVAVGASSIGMSLAESSGLIGTFSGNVAHSNAGQGLALTSSNMSGVMASCSVWRNAAGGGFISAVVDMLVSDFIAFGNATQNISFSASSSVRLKSPILNGDTSFSTNYGLLLSTAGMGLDLIVEDGDFSTVSGIKTAHTAQDIGFAGSCEPLIVLRNTKLGAATEVATSGMSERGYVSSQKHDRTAGNHVTWMKHGTVQSDTTIYRTAAPSLRMTPSMAQHPITALMQFTAGSAVLTVVPAYFFDWIQVGDWMTNSTAYPSGARVISLNVGASTITMDRLSGGVGASTFIIYRGKLPSAPPDKGFLIAANSGQTFGVGVWVRKQQENLFTYSEDFSNAAWTAFNTTRTGNQSDWAGGTTASQFLETVTNAGHGLQRTSVITISAGAPYTFSCYVKSVGRQWLRLNDSSAGRTSWIDVANGIVGTTYVGHTVSLVSAGSGWYRLVITFVAEVNATQPNLLVSPADNTGGSFVGDVTKGFVTGGWQLEQGSAALAYQVTTATAISGYNGYVNPRLMQRANPAIGIASDVVLDTMTSPNGVWEQLTGTTTAPTGDDGVIELYVDCEGTTGWVNVDDFSVI